MTIQRLATQQAGAIGATGIGLAAAPDQAQIAVSAVRNGSGNLELIAWQIAASGSITRRGDSGNQAGTSHLIGIARAGYGRFVTSVRAANGDLVLIAWNVDDVTGAVTRLGDADDTSPPLIGPTTRIAMGSRGDGTVIIAVRDGAGNLVVKHWEVKADGLLKRLGDTFLQGQLAGAISSVAVWAGGHVVTPVRSGSGTLLLISWEVTPNGGLKRVADSGQQAGAITTDGIGVVGITADTLITVIVDSSAHMKLVAWKVSSSGGITRLGDSGEQSGHANVIACTSPTVNRVVTAVRTNEGKLKLIRWEVNPSTGAIQRMADSGEQAGAVSHIACDSMNSSVVVTAVRDSVGNLELITWNVA